jgi:hypothetical protein
VKNFKYILFVLVSITFIGCGGGGGGEASFEKPTTCETEGTNQVNADTNESIPPCTLPFEQWIVVDSNDLVQVTTEGTELMIDHDQEENKKVCTKTGSAVVIRRD